MEAPDTTPRPFVVLKFGGTSVASRACWETIEALVLERIAEGLRPVVVASAVAGVSNDLERVLADALQSHHEAGIEAIATRHLELAGALDVDGAVAIADELEALRRIAHGVSLTGDASPPLHARVLSLGERMSTRLGAAYLTARGLSVAWVDARELLRAEPQVGASERRRYLSAVCDADPEPDVVARLDAAGGDVVLTQGFVASDARGHAVLLGRGGSDTSASYLAAKIGAARCEIWTDVPGLYTADPRRLPTARLLKRLSYEEAQELTASGARVLHPACIAPVARHGIPLHVRSIAHPEVEGTVVSTDAGGAVAQVKAISVKRGVTLVAIDTPHMWQAVGFLADVFAVFARHGLSVDLVSTSQTNVTVSLDAAINVLDTDSLDAVLRELRRTARAEAIGPTAVVSLVGNHIRSILHLLGPALEALEDERIYLVSQAANDLSFTFVVDEEHADRLARTLHGLLFQRRGEDALFGPTWHEMFEGNTDDPVIGAQAWWREGRDALLALAAEAGTPLYVYDRATLERSVRDLASLTAVDRVFYAVKANAHAGILRLFHDLGLGFECVSPGEFDRVLGLFPGLDPGRVLFTPNFAPRSEYAAALDRGVHVTLDNLHPLEAWPELFRDRPLFVRLDPGKGRGHHKHVHTAGNVSKFGIARDQMDALAALVARAGARVVGLHAHTGSGILEAGNWKETALYLAEAAQRFPDVRYLDLGGGLGVPEKPGQGRLDLVAVDENLAGVRQAFPGVELWLEPGRYLVATAGVLLVSVTQLKDKGPYHYVGVDTGMNSLIRPALYGAYHEIVNLTRLDQAPVVEANVVGPICESGDTLGYDRRLAAPREGDVLLVATAGAYGRAMSSHYNLRPPAAERMFEPLLPAATSPAGS